MPTAAEDDPHVALAGFVATVARDLDVLLAGRDVLLEPVTGAVDVFGPLAESWSSYRADQMDALLAAVGELPFGSLVAAGLTGPSLFARLTVCGQRRDGASLAWTIAAGEPRTQHVEAFTPDLHEKRLRSRLLQRLLTWTAYYLQQIDAVLEAMAVVLPGIDQLRQTRGLVERCCGLGAELLA